MVFTHLPANLCLIAAALAPTLEVALGLLLVRSLLSQMELFAAGAMATPLVLCGVLKSVYDVALLVMFRKVPPQD
jgi:hypothetical protein